MGPILYSDSAPCFNQAMPHLYDISVNDIKKQPVGLDAYKGKVLLIVNVASKCGFTPQYEGLEALQKKLAPRGFTVLGFPCNQFGKQEPGDEAEIQKFCELTYQVDFPLFAKVDVNGKNADPLFTFLKSEKKGVLGTTGIKWNFTKFLVDKSGNVVKRYAPTDTPASIEKDILALL